MRKRVVIVMIKVPQAGRVKTRLARDIGKIDALWWYRHQVARLLRVIGRDPRWTCVIAISPDVMITSRGLPAGFARIPQGRGGLGRRMLGALARFREHDVVLVGGDIPGIDCNVIARAFDALAGKDVVLGPATDGGFWLIGRRAQAVLPVSALDGVRWSTSHTLADSVQRLSGRNRIAMTDELADVDVGADLRRR